MLGTISGELTTMWILLGIYYWRNLLITQFMTDGLRSHVTNHSATDSVSYASFGVRSYYSTSFAEEWNIHKKRPFFPLSLTGNYRSLRFQCGAMNELYEQRNGTTWCLLMIPASACNITMVKFSFGDTLIELLPWPDCSPVLLPIGNVWSMLAQRLAQVTSLASS
ncbi:hypothetical protein TNCV_2000591 [Trichonephila clavipes]|nr:hypothetical protein TNCV_2000591 [Trichonephila clavipes]